MKIKTIALKTTGTLVTAVVLLLVAAATAEVLVNGFGTRWLILALVTPCVIAIWMRAPGKKRLAAAVIAAGAGLFVWFFGASILMFEPGADCVIIAFGFMGAAMLVSGGLAYYIIRRDWSPRT